MTDARTDDQIDQDVINVLRSIRARSRRTGRGAYASVFMLQGPVRVDDATMNASLSRLIAANRIRHSAFEGYYELS